MTLFVYLFEYRRLKRKSKTNSERLWNKCNLLFIRLRCLDVKRKTRRHHRTWFERRLGIGLPCSIVFCRTKTTRMSPRRRRNSAGTRNQVSFRSASFLRLNFITELELNREDIIIHIYVYIRASRFKISLRSSPSFFLCLSPLPSNCHPAPHCAAPSLVLNDSYFAFTTAGLR